MCETNGEVCPTGIDSLGRDIFIGSRWGNVHPEKSSNLGKIIDPVLPVGPATGKRFFCYPIRVARMCCNFAVEPKVEVDDRKFSSSQRTDRE